MTSRNRSDAGFTLFEILIVLVILGVVLGLVVSRGPLRSATLDVRSAASTIAQGLRLARGHAITTNRPSTFVLDTVTHSFRVDNAPPRYLPPNIEIAARVVADETGRGRLVGGIRFEPDGSSSGGSIALAEGGRRMSVDVDWLTGRVSVANAK